MKEAKLKDFFVRDFAIFYVAAMTILAIVIRSSFIYFESGDYVHFQKLWYDHLAGTSGLSGFASDFSNYSPLYLYLIKLCTLLPFSKVVSIKLISIAFDFMIAIYGAKLVSKVSRGRSYAALTYGVLLFTPTIFVNSSFWGQVDSAPAACILASLYYLSGSRYLPGFVWFGLAFSFKLQALFVFPMLIGLYFVTNLRAVYFLLIPAVYVISIVPAWLGGGRLGTLLSVYFNQAGYYSELTKNAPNLYFIFSGDFAMFRRMGLALAMVAAISIPGIIVMRGVTFTPALLVRVALLCSLTLPFVLPQMHERYFFTADVLAVVLLALVRTPATLYVAVAVVLVSLLSYFPFLFTRQPPIPFPFLALIMLSAICLVAVECFRKEPDNGEPEVLDHADVELGRS